MYFALMFFKIRPSEYAAMNLQEKACIIAAADLKIEAERKQLRSIRKRGESLGSKYNDSG